MPNRRPKNWGDCSLIRLSDTNEDPSLIPRTHVKTPSVAGNTPLPPGAAEAGAEEPGDWLAASPAELVSSEFSERPASKSKVGSN